MALNNAGFLVKSSPMWKSPWLWLAIDLLAIVALSAAGPAEKSLGVNVRVVYLHGAWVWAALAGFLAAAVAGLVGLASRRDSWNRWSRALGRAGMVFWITYLPLSLWAMQVNWNGLFLAEPRWRLAAIFSLGGLAIQLGVTLLGAPVGASVANIFFFSALLLALRTTENVMHPASPIFGSDALRIQIFFVSLLLLTLFAVWQIARLWMRVETVSDER
jgi:hypothetical protein